MKHIKRDLLSFEYQIRRCDIYGSYDVAEHTLKLVLKAIEPLKVSFEVERSIKFIVETLMDHFPSDVIIVNVCKIILNRLNDELPHLSQPKKRNHEVKKSRSIIDMMTLANEEVDKLEPKSELKTRISEFLEGQIENLASSYEMIAKNAPSFLFMNDVIMTVGNSSSIFKFLTSCQRDITVVVPEGAPSYNGSKFARKLSREKSIRAIVIPDSAIFALLPRVNKVIVPARAVLCNGGIVSFSLTHSIALAAKHYAKPFIALYWVMKLAEKVARPGATFTTLLEPEKIFEKENHLSSNVIALNAESDYVPPELITLMINEDGAHCPADVFSLVQENYVDTN